MIAENRKFERYSVPDNVDFGVLKTYPVNVDQGARDNVRIKPARSLIKPALI